MTFEPVSEAFDEGYDAAWDGKGEADCPHPAGQDREDWLEALALGQSDMTITATLDLEEGDDPAVSLSGTDALYILEQIACVWVLLEEGDPGMALDVARFASRRIEAMLKRRMTASPGGCSVH